MKDTEDKFNETPNHPQLLASFPLATFLCANQQARESAVEYSIELLVRIDCNSILFFFLEQSMNLGV